MKIMNLFGRTSMAYAGILLGGAAMGALLLGPQFAQTAEADPIVVQAPSGAPLSFADLIEKVSPAVVSVNVTGEAVVGSDPRSDFFERFREDFLGQDPEDGDEDNDGDDDDEPETRETRGTGSGFFISEDGLAVTNDHVINGATEIQLVLSDGTEIDAELIGTDPETDLAVVKALKPGVYPYVEFDLTDEVRVGDWVVALGNPFGLGGTATAGIVSADGRDLGRNSPYTNFLQIDASINRGNSGGPTFDLNGRVIGVNAQILSPTGGSVGIGFAIPAKLASEITKNLVEDGEIKRGWLGVQIGDFRPEFADALDVKDGKGALVADVTSGSPASKAGIKRSDVIVQLNGRDVEDANELTRRVARLRVNSQNEFVVLRRGARRVINVTVGERPKDINAPREQLEGPEESDEKAKENAEKVLGAALGVLDDEKREALGLEEGDLGVYVEDIERSSPFAEAVRAGFAILEVNGQPVDSAAKVTDIIDDARKANKDKVLVTVHSVFGTNFATVDISGEE